MQKNLLFSIILVFIILISGCINTGTETGNGIIIEEFYAYPDSVYSGEHVNFRLKFRNVGSVEATRTHAEVLGIDQDWCCEPIGEGPWRNKEKLPEEVECRYTTSSNDKIILLQPFPERGTAGEYHVCTWTYVAPHIPEGSLTYDVTARTFYTYMTDVVQSVTLASQAEMESVQNLDKLLPSKTVSSTRSPIKINIVREGPIRFWENNIEFPVKFEIRNTDTGSVCLKDCPNPAYDNCCKGTTKNWDRMVLKITLDKGMELIDCDDEMEITLWKGKSNEFSCKVKADTSNIDAPVQKLITVHSEYNYFVDKVIKIKVISKID